MGDKSPKSKHRSQSQKDSAKAGREADAKSKQDKQSRAPQTPVKGRR